MGHARDHLDTTGNPDHRRLHFLFPGDVVSVRSGLSMAMEALRRMNVSSHLESVIEIALAEVLNNVVEHAYAEEGGGVIEIEIERQDDGFSFCITDDGRPMPDNCLPEGTRRDLDVPAQDLPEGGFGWFLIRKLTQGLEYTRSANRNRLAFRIAFDTDTRPN